ncbi:MAG: hypothetical protein HUU26_05140 [Gemmatimonadaceae bacterium]|nr:hypothetical protein [Gemmatimonadaceae bacterium]
MQSLIPNPLHPAVVHLPIALAVLVPLVAIAALVFIRRGARARTAWGISVAALAALLLSGWVSLQTGEQQEERVEDVVAEQAIHGHEEAAELFLMTTAGVLALGLVGLTPGRLGSAGRLAATLGTIAILGTGWRVGHTGGMLVYRDGAASAYATGTASRSVGGDVERPRRDDDEGRRR